MTLAEVRVESSPLAFPRYALRDVRSALLLFCAGFHGRYDGIHVADAGVPEVTAVDLDEERLEEMRETYPPDWRFVHGDAYRFRAHEGAYELVGADPPSEHWDRCPEYLARWCHLSSKWVVMGIMRRWFEARMLPVDPGSLRAPEGWSAYDLRHRSADRGGVLWAVLRRDEE